MTKGRAPLDMDRPSKRTRGNDPSRAAQVIEQGTARLVVDMATDDHTRLKVRAAERGQSIRVYVLKLLAEDGIVISTKV